jgi:putative PIN family toxin of toxin-antitoxin system
MAESALCSHGNAPHVVLDTNVFVAAAFNPRSRAARVLDAVRDGRLRLIWDEATRRETRRILELIPPISWEPFASLFREENRHQGPVNPGWFGHVRDPEDRKFGALAYAADATLITRDDDLLEIRSNVSVPILTPTEFVERWFGATEGPPGE